MDEEKILVIVVPVFNQLTFTKMFVDSILTQDTTIFGRICTVFIDNASDDGETPEYLKNLPNVPHDEKLEFFYIHNSENLGFSKAVNQGVALLLGMYPNADILITNNDVEFLDGCWDALYHTAYSDEKYAIVGGKLLFPTGKIQHGGAFLSQLGWGRHKGGGKSAYHPFICNTEEEQEYVTGALFFVKNSFYKYILSRDNMFFDEQFSPAFFEELDLCYRAHREGYKVVYTPTARAVHYENATGKSLYGDSINLKRELSDTNQIKFYEKWPGNLTYPEDNEKKFKLLLQGKIYGAWSFSGTLRKLALALDNAGVDVSIAPEEYHNIGDMPDWRIKKMILKPNDYWNRTILRHSEGDHMYMMPPGKKRVGYVALESSKLNPLWKDQLNNLDQVLAVSSFVKRVLQDGGVTTPVDILPNCVDTSIYREDVPIYDIPDKPSGFGFYSLFSFGERKGPNILLQAFIEEFSADDDVYLLIHSLSMLQILKQSKIPLDKWLNSFCPGKRRAPILVTTNFISDNILPSVIKNFDVFVLPTRAEGFGLPILEAASVGIPSIVTGYSGVLDIVNEENGWLIDYDLVDIPLQYLPYFKNYIGGKWANPSVEHLRHLMRYTYEHPDEVKEKGKKALQKAQTFSLDKIGKKAKELIFNTND